MKFLKQTGSVLILAILVSGQAAANVQSKFICRDTSGEVIVFAELDPQNNIATLSLRGSIANEITGEFTDKEPGFYKQVNIRTTTEGMECPFQRQWLYFSCAFHRYALARADNENGDSEYIRLGTNEGSISKGKIFDYADGTLHSIGVFLYKPNSTEQIFFGKEFEHEQCNYE